jgi:SAM-dependent methyltransferase
MKKEEYKVMFNIEDTYWWYVGLRKLVLTFIDSINKKRENLRILDAGCGTGKILDACKSYNIYGMDFSGEAIMYCKLRRVDNLIRGSICNLPFQNDSFDIVISLDVLYHKNVENDVETLKGLHQVMNNDGWLLLNLPAYNFLRSRHDEAVHTKRRYTRNNLKQKLVEAGFEIERITYRNTVLFPIAVTKRIIEKIFPSDAANADSDLKPLPYLLNKIFTLFLSFENKLIALGINLPFGLSVFCVARKKG